MKQEYSKDIEKEESAGESEEIAEASLNSNETEPSTGSSDPVDGVNPTPEIADTTDETVVPDKSISGWVKTHAKILKTVGLAAAGTLLLVGGFIAWKAINDGDVGTFKFFPEKVPATQVDYENPPDIDNIPARLDSFSIWTIQEDQDGSITILDNDLNVREGYTYTKNKNGTYSIFDDKGVIVTGIKVKFVSFKIQSDVTTSKSTPSSLASGEGTDGVGGSGGGGDQTGVPPDYTDDPAASTDEPPFECPSHSVVIELKGDSAKSTKCDNCGKNGTSIGVDESEGGFAVKINREGNYTVRGSLANGTLIIRGHATEDVNVTLENVSISCSFKPAIRTRRSSDGNDNGAQITESVNIIIPAGTTTTLTDNRPERAVGYDDPEELVDDHNSALYSRGDLVVMGGGSLVIKSGHFHGINSREMLTISNMSIDVNSINHGIRSQTQMLVSSSNINIKTKFGKGFRAAEDNYGSIRFNNSTLNLETFRDAVHASNKLYFEKTNVNAVVGGGSQLGNRDDGMSKRGLRANGEGDNALVFNNCRVNVDSVYAAVIASGNVSVNGCNMTLSSGGSAIKGRPYLTLTDSTVNVEVCNYALRVSKVEPIVPILTISNCNIFIHAFQILPIDTAKGGYVVDVHPFVTRCMGECHVPRHINDEDENLIGG